MARPRGDYRKRFWSKVTVGGENDCWDWTCCTDKNGYGLFQLAEPRMLCRAHRLSWSIANSPNDPIQCLLALETVDFIIHGCDRPCCVNPAHLSKADVLTNNQDKMSKGRFVPWNKGLRGVNLNAS